MHPLSAVGGGAGGGGLSLQPNFPKGGLDMTSTFIGVLLGKKGVTFFRWEGGGVRGAIVTLKIN